MREGINSHRELPGIIDVGAHGQPIRVVLAHEVAACARCSIVFPVGAMQELTFSCFHINKPRDDDLVLQEGLMSTIALTGAHTEN